MEREYDSQYLQRVLGLAVEDEQDENVKELIDWIIGRLNQSYPDGDVDFGTMARLAKDIRIAHVVQKIPNLIEVLEYYWS